MDFDDQDDGEEEMDLPVGSSYEAPVGNSSRGAACVGGTAKMSGSGAGAEAAGFGGSGHWKGSGVGGGGRYRECLKNHAVGIGGHAVDGCGEFMAAGEEGTLDALRCAACNCHRNFHRKESGGGLELAPAGAGYHPHFSPYYRTPAGYLHHHPHLAGAAPFAAAAHHHQRPSAALALPSISGGGGGGGQSMSRDEDDVSNPMMAMGIGGSSGGLGMGLAMGVGASGAAGSSSGKKRFRTKFSQEQKDKMLAFADRLGWRIQKHDEAAVQQFCNETSVKRHVLKVWMHNNKHTMGKKP